MLCNFQHPPGSGRLRSFIASGNILNSADPVDFGAQGDLIGGPGPMSIESS
jgi:hypothetical protein